MNIHPAFELSQERLALARRILLEHPEGVRDVILAVALRCSRQNAAYTRRNLGAKQVRYGLWTLAPTEDDIAFARLILWRSQEESWAEETVYAHA
jgi:hypothetical protein